MWYVQSVYRWLGDRLRLFSTDELGIIRHLRDPNPWAEDDNELPGNHSRPDLLPFSLFSSPRDVADPDSHRTLAAGRFRGRDDPTRMECLAILFSRRTAVHPKPF